MKKTGLLIFLCFIIFWSGKILSVNQIKDEVFYSEMRNTLDYMNISVTPLESHLYTVDQYIEKFNITLDDLNLQESDSDNMLICVCLKLTNQSNENISWDELMGSTQGGFETVTWMSSVDPYRGSIINVFTQEALTPNTSQNIWYVTTVNKICFKSKNWDNIHSCTFYYVLPLEPQKIKLKLEI